MRKLTPLVWTVAFALLLTAGLTGCKKKPVTDTPPTPAVTQPATPPPPPPPPPEEPKQVEEDFDRVDDPVPTRSELADRLQGQLKTVYFEFDKSELGDTTRRVLEDNARVLKVNPDFTIVVEGHCDDRGTIEYNLALGQRRAAAVRDYLVTLGIPTGRMRTVSYGEERPAAPGSNESAWSRNRRAEFTVE